MANALTTWPSQLHVGSSHFYTITGDLAKVTKSTLPAGFGPAQGDPSGIQVQCLM